MGKRLWYLLTTHFFDLLRANLLYALFSLPVITIPAALCGLYAVVLQYWRVGYGELFGTFWREFKANFFSSLALTAALEIDDTLWRGDFLCGYGCLSGLCADSAGMAVSSACSLKAGSPSGAEKCGNPDAFGDKEKSVSPHGLTGPPGELPVSLAPVPDPFGGLSAGVFGDHNGYADPPGAGGAAGSG